MRQPVVTREGAEAPILEPTELEPNRRRIATAAALILGFAIFSLAHRLQVVDPLTSKGWNAFFGEAQAELTSLVRDGEFPMWNPWRRGGQVAFGHPDSMFLSLVTPLAWVFGVGLAFKLLIVPLAMFLGFGAWRFAGELQLKGSARLAPALACIASSAIPLYVEIGAPNALFAYAFLPWILTLRRVGVRDHRAAVLGGFALAAVVFAGGFDHFVLFLGIVAVDASVDAAIARSWRPLAIGLTLLLFGSACALVRLLPICEVLRFASHDTNSLAAQRPISFSLLREAFLDPAGGNYGCNFGTPCVVLAALGLLFRPRRAGVLVVSGALLLAVVLGRGPIGNPWNALHSPEATGTAEAVAFVCVPAGLVLSLLVGFGVEALETWLRRARVANAPNLSLLLVVLVTAIPAAAHRKISAPRDDLGDPGADSRLASGGAVRSSDSPIYRGEVFLANGSGDVVVARTVNSIHVQAALERDDTLVVNQNGFPGFVAKRSGSGEIVPIEIRDGLLALRLSAGRHDLSIEYHSQSTLLGAVLSTIALFLGGIALRRRGTAPDRISIAEWSALGFSSIAVLAVPLLPNLLPFESRTHTIDDSAVRSRARTIFVDATKNGADSIQAVIDSASPGDVVLVAGGVYSGFRVNKGVALLAKNAGSVRIEQGGITIEDVAAGPPVRVSGFEVEGDRGTVSIRRCETGVVLDGLTIAPLLHPGPALAIDHCDAVHLGRSQIGGSIVLDTGILTISMSAIATPDPSEFPAGSAPAPGLEVNSGLALLMNSSVATSIAPALLLRHAAVEFSGAAVPSVLRKDGGAIAKLAEGSSLRVQKSTGIAEAVECDATSRFSVVASRPTVTFESAPSMSESTRVVIVGEGSSRGELVVASRSLLVDERGPRQWLLAPRIPGRFSIPVTLPASGRREIQVPIGGGDFGVGSVVFLQYFATGISKAGATGPGSVASHIEGSTIVP